MVASSAKVLLRTVLLIHLIEIPNTLGVWSIAMRVVLTAMRVISLAVGDVSKAMGEMSVALGVMLVAV